MPYVRPRHDNDSLVSECEKREATCHSSDPIHHCRLDLARLSFQRLTRSPESAPIGRSTAFNALSHTRPFITSAIWLHAIKTRQRLRPVSLRQGFSFSVCVLLRESLQRIRLPRNGRSQFDD